MTRGDALGLAAIACSVASLVMLVIGAYTGAIGEEYAKGAFYIAWSISADMAGKHLRREGERS